MKVDELKRAKDQRPFQPFGIRTAGGRSITVRHPDTLARDDPESPRTAAGIIGGGGWAFIDRASITSPARPAEGPPAGGVA